MNAAFVLFFLRTSKSKTVLCCEVDKTVFALGRRALKRKVLKLYDILNKAFLFFILLFLRCFVLKQLPDRTGFSSTTVLLKGL